MLGELYRLLGFIDLFIDCIFVFRFSLPFFSLFVVIFWACILGAKGRRPFPVSIVAQGFAVGRESWELLLLEAGY